MLLVPGSTIGFVWATPITIELKKKYFILFTPWLEWKQIEGKGNCLQGDRMRSSRFFMAALQGSCRLLVSTATSLIRQSQNLFCVVRKSAFFFFFCGCYRIKIQIEKTEFWSLYWRWKWRRTYDGKRKRSTRTSDCSYKTSADLKEPNPTVSVNLLIKKK